MAVKYFSGKNIDEKGLTLDLLPTIMESPCLRLANEEKAKQLTMELKERSKSLQDGSWYQG